MYDDPPQSEIVRSAAAIVARHREGSCPECKPQGCAELAWAQPTVDAWEQQWMAAAREATPAQSTGRTKRPADEGGNMNQLQWRTLKCDNSGPNCPEIAEDGGQVRLRSSNRPGDVAILDVAEFEVLKQKIIAGEV